MQTIDTIRKTNELSKVLKNHGFATDSFDAIAQANSIAGSRETSEILATATPTISRREQTAAVTDHSQAQKIQALERSKHILSTRVDTLQQELLKTQEALKVAFDRLEQAEYKLRNQRQATQSEATTGKQQTPEPAASQQPRGMPSNAASNDTPRSKQKIDESISIENVFYCGTR